jgi:hypothetical protein
MAANMNTSMNQPSSKDVATNTDAGISANTDANPKENANLRAMVLHAPEVNTQ